MLVFSCNQLQYKELNSFGGGNYSTTTHKIAQNQKATSNNFELIPNEESEKKIPQITPNKPTQIGNENLDNTPKKNRNKDVKTKITSNQIRHFVNETKSNPIKQFKKLIKSKKHLFEYEGENNAMTIGFNILIVSLILLALGMTFYLSDISYNTGTLFNAF